VTPKKHVNGSTAPPSAYTENGKKEATGVITPGGGPKGVVEGDGEEEDAVDQSGGKKGRGKKRKAVKE
jgi:hypothetical protein